MRDQGNEDKTGRKGIAAVQRKGRDGLQRKP